MKFGIAMQPPYFQEQIIVLSKLLMNWVTPMLQILAERLNAGVDEAQVTGAKTRIYKLLFLFKNLYNHFQNKQTLDVKELQ